VAKDLGIRRPDLPDARRLGTVRWVKDEKGYGRITADDGEVLWFHFGSIDADGYRSMEEGQRVSFAWRGGIQENGLHRAEAVRPEP
jgi:CspA family cold shock protein